MVWEKSHNGGQPTPTENQDLNLDVVITSLQQKLEEMTSTIQLQATTIRSLQQQSGGTNEQGDVDTHNGDKVEQRTEPQTAIVLQEPLYIQFCKMKPVVFEGSTNPLDAEEWISSIKLIVEFMELNDREKVLCASYMLKKEARYRRKAVKARREFQTMGWTDFEEEF